MSITPIIHASQMISRLASQYADKTKFRAFLAAVAAVPTNLEEAFADIGLVLDPLTAEGEQLDNIGYLVGVDRKLPNGSSIGDDDAFRVLILSKIARNACKGTMPEIIALLTYLFDPTSIGTDVHVQDLGDMALNAQIGRLLTATEKSVIEIASTTNGVPGGILPRPAGVSMALSERDSSDFFCFSDISDPGVALITGGIGFSDVGSPTGTWASLVTS